MEKGGGGIQEKRQTTSVIFTQPNNGDPDAPLIPNPGKRDEDGNYVNCKFISRFKTLSSVQMALGVVLSCLGLYSE